jgi:hypothetical protein
MGYKITLSNGTPTMSYDQDATIATDLLLSAMVPQGAFFLNPDFGLQELPKKITDQNMGLVKDSFGQSEKWLIDAGKAKSIDILVEPDLTENNRLDIQESATQANDTVVSFKTFVPLV